MNDRKIIHVDMDAFFASVEQRDNPQLKGQPVIVGGKPDGRGVVAACSYETRKFGVHSAMPSAEAARRCPQAVFVKPRFAAYREASELIYEVFREFTSHIEPLSIDEAFLDVTDNTLFGGSAILLAREIKSRVFQRTDLIASAGVSYNKFLAKIASDQDKPDGLCCIRPEQGEEFVAALPIGRFHGVGKVTEERMHRLGIRTGADLRAWTLKELEAEFGKSAAYYYRVARGIDERPVTASRQRKSIGKERTFQSDIEDPSEMLQWLTQICANLQRSMQDKKITARTIGIKVRFADFDTLTRAHSQSSGFEDYQKCCEVLGHLLDKALSARAQRVQSAKQRRRRHAGSGVRLLGVYFSSLDSEAGPDAKQLELDLSISSKHDQ
ncbi:MAG: DNA polymerase IV [Granulosicoccus sp.]|nr:DNA polymerase IV [Granulosicoccus sp.]